MTETPRPTDQPLPVPNDQPSVQSRLMAFLAEREQIGIKTYGTSLQPWNGRDGLRDALEEAVDLSVYLMQLITERDTRPAPTIPCEKCGEVDATAVVVWVAPQHRATFVVCPTCEVQYVREGTEMGAAVTSLPVYPPAPQRPAQPAPDAEPAAEPAKPVATVPTGEHVRQLRRAVETMLTFAEAAHHEAYPDLNVRYGGLVASALGGPIGNLAALFTPDVVAELARMLDTVATTIEDRENHLGRRLHPFDQSLARCAPAINAAVYLNLVKEKLA